MKTLYESILDIDDNINKDINGFSFLLNANSEKEYEDRLNVLMNTYNKINPVKILNTGSDINLKKGSLYLVHHIPKHKAMTISFTYIGIYGKSKTIGLHWKFSENKVKATIYNSPISNMSNNNNWYEIPSKYIKDFNEFKNKIKGKK